MKRTVILLGFLFICGILSAQITYLPSTTPSYNPSSYRPSTYRPSTSGYSNYNTSRPRATVEYFRATAYSIDFDGNLYKLPIKVQVANNGYGSISISVVQKYVNTGLGGEWREVYYGGNIQKCTPLASQNPLEKEFMYKVYFDNNTWYFDL